MSVGAAFGLGCVVASRPGKEKVPCWLAATRSLTSSQVLLGLGMSVEMLGQDVSVQVGILRGHTTIS